MRGVFISIAAAMTFSAAMYAQSYQGGIRGIVMDSNAGAMVNAKVTLTDEGTSVARSALTTGSGEYVFTSVNPATYTLAVEAPGFKRYERKAVVIGTQQSLTVDIQMDLGAVTDSVQVVEDVTLIESSNASTGQEIDHQKLIDLPLLGRNPFMFAKLSQNVVQVGDPRFNRFQDQSGSSQISIAGGPIRGNNYLIDGVPITDSQNRAVIIPSLEAVQEVKLQANTYDAEMGRTGGGVFNTFLRSGTNSYHGSLFGYTRQTEWVANDFFYNRSGTPRPDQPFYNFGGSLGGPVSIPKVYNGKNRSFIWAAWEGYRQKSPLSNGVTVPTAAERVGNFSQSPYTIFDPLTSVKNADGTVTRQPFAGNIIPQNRLNPAGLAIASFYPLPQTNVAGVNNYQGTDTLTDRADEFTVKGDQEIFQWWKVNASYLHYKSREPSGDLLHTTGSNQNLLYRKVDAIQLNSIMTPNATTVVSLRYGFNRFPNEVVEQSNGLNLTTLGLPAYYNNSVQARFFPGITMQTSGNLGDNSQGSTFFYSRSFLASVAKYFGKHSVKAGFDYRKLHIDFIDLSNASGNFSFDNGFTRADPTKPSASGNDIASLLLGYPSGGSVDVATKLYTYINYYAGYIHDDYRVSSKLTLNIGLRYEWETGIAEKQNRYAVGFDRNVVNPLAANVTGVVPRGGIMFAGQNGNPTTCCNPSKTKFAPRFGAAYALNSKTTIRGGYGIFYSPIPYTGSGNLAPGYQASTAYVSSNDGGLTPANLLSNPYPNGFLQPIGNALGLLQSVGSSVTVLDQFRKSPIVHQYSFDVQRELPYKIALVLGYVGSHSRNLPPGANININQLSPAYLSEGTNLFNAVPNPYYGRGGTGVIGGTTVSLSQSLRPYSQFSSVSIATSSSKAQYDSLVVKVQKRMSNGLNFLGTWTYSKNMDASFGAPNSLVTSSTAPQDVYNLDAEYAYAINDTPHTLTGSFTYELPFGAGKRFATGNRYISYFVGGWSLNGTAQYRTGFPLAITQNTNNNSIIGAGVQRPNATGISPNVSGSVQSRLDSYINPAAFSTAPAFTFGNLARTIGYRGPGQKNWDVSGFKNLRITEKITGQFRAEALNLFNSPLFQGPNVKYGSSNFGKITQQRNFSRMIQLGVRFYF
jgi:hypothetical protein